MENSEGQGTSQGRVVPANQEPSLPVSVVATSQDNVMLPSPPKNEFVSGFLTPLPYSPAVSGSPFERALAASQSHSADPNTGHVPQPYVRNLSSPGYPSQPLAYPPQYYQGPAQSIQYHSFPPALPSGKSQVKFANNPNEQDNSFPVGPRPPGPIPGPSTSTSHTCDSGTGESSWAPFGLILAPSFRERKAQQHFIRKVLMLVLVQLMMVIGMSIVAISVDPVEDYLKETSWVMWTAWASTIGLMFFGLSTYKLLHHHPYNIIYFCSFVTFAALGVASVVGKYNGKVVILACFLSSVLVFGLMLMAWFGKFDMTNSGGMLFAALLLLVVTSFIGMFWANSILQITIAAGAAVVFGIYIVFDIQMLMDNKRRPLEPEEHVLGSVTIYLDIIYILGSLLSMLTCSRCCRKGDVKG